MHTYKLVVVSHFKFCAGNKKVELSGTKFNRISWYLFCCWLQIYTYTFTAKTNDLRIQLVSKQSCRLDLMSSCIEDAIYTDLKLISYLRCSKTWMFGPIAICRLILSVIMCACVCTCVYGARLSFTLFNRTLVTR